MQNICRLGFGTWQLGGESQLGGKITGWGVADDKESIEALLFAFEQGIRFFDTAPTYGRGRSESIIAQALASYYQDKHPPIICTKYGLLEENGQLRKDYSERSLLQQVNDSLQRLHRDYVDMLLLHSPPDDFDWKNFDTAPFERLRTEGKILRYGVSVRTLHSAKQIMSAGFGSVIEGIYNILDRRAEEVVFTHKNFEQYCFIARVPLASGFLSPKTLQQERTFPTSDIRSTLNNEMKQWMTDAVCRLAFLDAEPGGINVQALKYILQQPKVSFVIPGMRNREHVKMNLQSLSNPLSQEIIQKIHTAVPTTFHGWM